MSITTIFSERLQALARLKKIDQSDLAKGINVDSAAINRWWNGKIIPRPKSIRAIAEFFECDINWLAEGTGEPFSSVSTDNLYRKAAGIIDDALSGAIRDRRGGEKNAEFNGFENAEPERDMVRMYRQLAEMDADTFGEIQTWINDMEKVRPGFTGWFRIEFQNRFPEFDEWKRKQQKIPQEKDEETKREAQANSGTWGNI